MKGTTNLDFFLYTSSKCTARSRPQSSISSKSSKNTLTPLRRSASATISTYLLFSPANDSATSYSRPSPTVRPPSLTSPQPDTVPPKSSRALTVSVRLLGCNHERSPLPDPRIRWTGDRLKTRCGPVTSRCFLEWCGGHALGIDNARHGRCCQIVPCLRQDA